MVSFILCILCVLFFYIVVFDGCKIGECIGTKKHSPRQIYVEESPTYELF